MKVFSSQVKSSHLRVTDFDAFFVGAMVERAFDLQAGSGRRGADQFDDGEAIAQRTIPPVLGDMAE